MTDDEQLMRGPRYGYVSVHDGELVDDFSIRDTYESFEEAYFAAEKHCADIADADEPLKVGEGFFIFEIRPVRFVGRTGEVS